ncbi:RNA recognition motif 2-domain-containing protein, partial [Chytridium lagenaria]
DKRTTVMLKNVPNRYTQEELIEFVNETHRGCFDFLYLRMDFLNRCNVGCIFVDSTAIITFAARVHGKKWPKFNSEKVPTVCYANIQTRHALIEKFRNSSVMLEDPSYRPKLFHTSGPNRGSEEPFPSPT